MSEIDRFVDVYAQALRDENATIFAGAGTIHSADLVDWSALMRDIGHDVA